MKTANKITKLPQSMTIIVCCTCSMEFGVSQVFKDHRIKDGLTFWCPMGHGQCFADSRKANKDLEIEKLEKKVEELEAEKAKPKTWFDYIK